MVPSGFVVKILSFSSHLKANGIIALRTFQKSFSRIEEQKHPAPSLHQPKIVKKDCKVHFRSVVLNL